MTVYLMCLDCKNGHNIMVGVFEEPGEELSESAFEKEGRELHNVTRQEIKDGTLEPDCPFCGLDFLAHGVMYVKQAKPGVTRAQIEAQLDKQEHEALAKAQAARRRRMN